MMGDSATLDVSGFFSEPDGQELAYSAAVSDSSRLSAAAEAAEVTIVVLAKGDVVVTVTDPGGLSATQSLVVTARNRPPVAVDSIAAQSFTVIVANRAPIAVGWVPDLTIVRDENLTFSISDYFSDPDGDVLTYSGATANPGIARVSVSGAAVTLTGVATGETTLTLTATDPEGLTVTQMSRLEVTARGRGSGFGLSLQYHPSATAAVRAAVGGAAANWKSTVFVTDFADVTLSTGFTYTVRGATFTIPAGTPMDDIVIAVGAGAIDGSRSPSPRRDGDVEQGSIMVIDADGNVVRVIPGAAQPPADPQRPPAPANRRERP